MSRNMTREGKAFESADTQSRSDKRGERIDYERETERVGMNFVLRIVEGGMMAFVTLWIRFA